ncbi:MAG TPA: LLM class flavin-dependent oxidoreductase [Amycolatopsis sp.]|nr:LLM class flavin-dependent oxidoreductase [Amycolatopsis sp.]
MKIGLRYDMRAPDLGPGSAAPAALYEAAVEQVVWADEKGFDAVYLAEHHGAEDNYCPAPMILAAAMAGATRSIALHLSALCVTMHHPLRLAEDLAVLDLVAGSGRLLVTAGMGYRPHEFEMFGVDHADRAQVYEQALEVLAKAWTGEEFVFGGTKVRVTPKAASPGGPTLYIGGNAKPSARRAARLGLGYRPASKELYEYYEGECAKLGLPAPEPFPAHGPAFVHVTEDPERTLAQLAPHLVHASTMYARWAGERSGTKSNGYWAELDGVASIKADPNMWIVTPAEAVERLASLPPDYELRLHPLLGGIPPELAWESLRLLADQVLPRVPGKR